MPTTRSSTRKQTKLEDFAEAGTEINRVKSTQANSSAKRKTSDTENAQSASTFKKLKKQQHHISSKSSEQLENPIVINRAPVLQLWGAVVAQFIHDGLSWQACLSIGNAISSLCAISKGRAIGMIEPKDEKSADRKEQKAEAKKNTDEVSIMGFLLRLKNDEVILSGKPKPFREDTLKHKFGEEHYETTKKAMQDDIRSWSDDKDELDSKAFHMYEKFRPNIASGQQGWGRKGELSLQEVASAIRRRA